MATLLKQDEMPSSTTIPYGMCHCGCGRKTSLSTATRKSKGRFKGKPNRFINGHHSTSQVAYELPEIFYVEGEPCRRLPLGKGLYAIVDAKVYEWLAKWKWHSIPGGYAVRYGRELLGEKRAIFMHCEVFDPSGKSIADHKNQNKRDNRRSNLRPATYSENGANRGLHRNNTSGFKGVCWNAGTKSWKAQIRCLGEHYYLGLFAAAEEAARAYDAKALELFGEFAHLNFPIQRGATSGENAY